MRSTHFSADFSLEAKPGGMLLRVRREITQPILSHLTSRERKLPEMYTTRLHMRVSEQWPYLRRLSPAGRNEIHSLARLRPFVYSLAALFLIYKFPLYASPGSAMPGLLPWWQRLHSTCARLYTRGDWRLCSLREILRGLGLPYSAVALDRCIRNDRGRWSQGLLRIPKKAPRPNRGGGPERRGIRSGY